MVAPNKFVFNGVVVVVAGAVVVVGAAVELNPNEADNYISKGFVLVESNNYNEAILNYDKSIEINSNLIISSYFNKANLMKQLKYYDEALKLYNMILNETPNDSIVLYNQGLCFLDMNCNDKALKCFDKAIKYNPTYSNAYYSKGYLLAFKLKKYNQAIDYFNKSIDLNTKCIDSYIGKGYCLHNLNKLDESKIAYKQAIEYDAENPIIYYNIGCVLMKQKKFKDAIQYFDKVLNIEPNNNSALNNKNIASKMLVK